jgi:uncharacterized protein (DUF58 family)
MLRPRRRALGLLVGAGLLFFLGTNVQAGWLFVLAALLFGATAAGAVLPLRMVSGLEVERRAPDEVHQGEAASVDLAVINGSRGMRVGVVLEDTFLQTVSIALPPLRPGERVEISTRRVAARRGPQAAAPVRARSSAPFGVSERRTNLTGAGAMTLVLPTVVPLGSLPFVRPAATSDHAIHSAPRRGQGPEYLGIREYRPGDSMRHVHWPSTARTGVVMVREFEQEQTRRLALVVDGAWDAGGAWTPLDRVCAAAASIAMAALSEGHGARLVVPDGDTVEVLARTDGAEILRALALVSPSPLTRSIDAVLAELGSELRGIETAVIVLPARRGNDVIALQAAAASLAGSLSHLVVVAIEVTPEESRSQALPPGGWTELEDRLRAAGAEVFPWRDGDDLSAVLSPEVPLAVEDDSRAGGRP